MVDGRRRGSGQDRRRVGIPQPEWGDNVVSADFTRGRARSAVEKPAKAQWPAPAPAPAPRQETPTRRPESGSDGATAAETRSDSWAAGQIMRTATALADSARLSRGRTYYRGGNVVHIDHELGRVNGVVSGTQLEPFEVQIRWRPLTRRQVDFIVGECADHPESVRKLMAGLRPESSIATVLFGVEHYMDSHCTCPDHSTFCKHRVCVAYALAAEFTGDPGAFLAWRGIDMNQLLETAGGSDPASEETAAGENPDGGYQETRYSPAEFWGEVEALPTWDPLEIEIGLELGDTARRDLALRKFSWNNADQLRVLDTLSRCYEAFTTLDDPAGQRTVGGRVFEREPWMSGPGDSSGDHD